MADDKQMSDEDLDRLSNGLPPVASGPALDPGTEGPAEMPGDRGAPPTQPGDVQAPDVSVPAQGAAPVAPTAATAPGVPPALAAPGTVAPQTPPGTHAVKGTETVETQLPSAESQAGEQGEIDAIQRKAKNDATIAGAKAEEDAKVADAAAEAYRAKGVQIEADKVAEADRKAAAQKEHDAQWAQLQQDAKQKPPMFGNMNALEGVLGIASMVLSATARGSAAPGRGGWGAIAAQGLNLVEHHVDQAYQQHAAEIEERFKELVHQDGYNDGIAQRAQAAIVAARAEQAQAYLHAGDYITAAGKALGTPQALAAADNFVAVMNQNVAKVRAAAGVAQNVKTSTSTTFAPGKAGAGGGGGGNALAQVVDLVTATGDRAAGIRLAQKLGLSPREYTHELDAATAAHDKKEAAANKTDANGRKIPKEYVDPVTKQVFPVDPNRTDTAAFNHAQTVLPAVGIFDATATELLKNGPGGALPAWFSAIGFDTTARNNAEAAVIRLRSKYAAAFKESVGAKNSDELAEAIPMPPTSQTKEALENWQARIKAARDEMHDLRTSTALTAGIDLDHPSKGATAGGESKSFSPGRPKILNGKTYVEVGPNNWQPQ